MDKQRLASVTVLTQRVSQPRWLLIRVHPYHNRTNPWEDIGGRILSFDFAEKRIDKGQDTTPMPYQLLRLEVGFVLDPPCPPIRLGFEFLAGDLNEGGLCFLAWRGIWIVQQFNQCGDHLSIAHAEFAAR